MPEDYDSFDSQQRRKFWQTHIEQWQASGLSQRAYCIQHDPHGPRHWPGPYGQWWKKRS